MKKSTVIILLLIIVAIAVYPLLTIKDSEFGGADGEAEGVISELDPNYEPWFESIMEPPGGETESLLFSLQAGIGSGIVGYGLGYLVARSKFSNNKTK